MFPSYIGSVRDVRPQGKRGQEMFTCNHATNIPGRRISHLIIGAVEGRVEKNAQDQI